MPDEGLSKGTARNVDQRLCDFRCAPLSQPPARERQDPSMVLRCGTEPANLRAFQTGLAAATTARHWSCDRLNGLSLIVSSLHRSGNVRGTWPRDWPRARRRLSRARKGHLNSWNAGGLIQISIFFVSPHPFACRVPSHHRS
jgi:hypothetical protein